MHVRPHSTNQVRTAALLLSLRCLRVEVSVALPFLSAAPSSQMQSRGAGAGGAWTVEPGLACPPDPRPRPLEPSAAHLLPSGLPL